VTTEPGQRCRFSVADFLRMEQAGLFVEDARVELVDGDVADMHLLGDRVAAARKRSNAFFARALGGRAIVAVNDCIELSRYDAPRPGLALLKPHADFCAEVLPGVVAVLPFGVVHHAASPNSPRARAART
jgi:hypothetical protein